MADLGEFGRARVVERAAEDGVPVEPDVFRFHGERFEVPAHLSSLVLMEFAHDATVNDAALTAAQSRVARAADEADAAGDDVHRKSQAAAELSAAEHARAEAVTANLSAMYRYIRACVGDEQWDRFRAVVLREGVDEDELMLVCGSLFEAVAARPTRRPSASPDGPSPTGVGSTAGSGSPEATPGPGRVIAGEVLEPSGRVLAMPTPLERQNAEFEQWLKPVPTRIHSSG